MVKYMVAVDESKNARVAFEAVLSLMNSERDELWVFTVVEDLAIYALSAEVVAELFRAQDAARHHAKHMLNHYGKICDEKKIKHHLLYAVSNHIGESVCKAVETKEIDILVVGRRGMGRVKRLFIGSNSTYCLEHALCSVLVVKGDHPPGIPEVICKDVPSTKPVEEIV